VSPQRSSSDQQQIGRLIEAMEETKSGRVELKTEIASLSGLVRGLDQKIQSTASQIAILINQDLGSRMTAIEKSVTGYDAKLTRYDTDDCAKRLTSIESDLRYYKSVLGTGWGVLWRMVVFLLSSATVAAFAQQFFHRLTGG
jgi:hypothetical protein